MHFNILRMGWLLDEFGVKSTRVRNETLRPGELRDAFVWLGDERAYLTKSYRVTAGVRLSFNEHVTLKVEYLYNSEYGMPSVPNDVYTSSLVLAY